MLKEAFLFVLAFLSVNSVFRLNVNAADSALKDADLGAVAAGNDNAGLFLDADDLADDTADGGDLVTHLKVVSHGSGLFFLLLLRANAKEVKNYEDNYHKTHSQPHAAAALGGLCK